MSYLNKIDELITAGELDKAKEMCKENENEHKIKFRVARILFMEDKIEEAEKMCKEFPDDIEMQALLITILTQEGKYEEAKEICGKYMDKLIAFKAQYVKILMKQGKYGEVERICLANIERPIFVSQLVDVYVKQGRYVEAKNVCRNNINIPTMEMQLKNINKAYKEKSKEISKEKNDKIPFINRIKTRIYLDDIPNDYIEEIKNSNLNDWKKMVALMAIYKKRKENKNAEMMFKEAKKTYKNDPGKSKKLNMLGSYITSNKQKMIDWNAFDKTINWEIDENYAEEIRNKREQEEIKKKEQEEKEKQEKQEEIVQQEENKIIVIQQESIKEEDKKVEEKQEEKEEVQIKEIKIIPNMQNSEVRKKVKKNKNKEKEKNKSKNVENKEELTMNDVYKEEIFEVKKQINIRANTSNINYIKEFNAVDNLEEKSAKDLRAKMQLVMYLRKYGKDKIAEESMPQEYEIYDLINKMLMYKRADSKYDDSEILEEIMSKVEKIDGNNEYIYELIEKAYKKNEEQR